MLKYSKITVWDYFKGVKVCNVASLSLVILFAESWFNSKNFKLIISETGNSETLRDLELHKQETGKAL